MPRRTTTSLHWLTFAVLLPLVLIATLAALGTRSQLQAAWADARAEAGRLAPGLAASLEQTLKASVNEIATYPDPPVPGTPSPADEILDGTDLDALQKLQNDPEAGLSPAGLPRRALAALALHRLDPTRMSNDLEGLLTVEAPSILTSLAVGSILTGEIVEQRWKEEEEIRELVRNLDFEKDLWIRKDGNFLYLLKEGETVAYAKFPDIHFNDDGDLPVWLQARLALSSDPESLEALAGAAVGLGHGLLVQLYPVADLIEAPVRRQQRWTLAILAVSCLTAAVALAALHRTLRRERQLNEMKSQFVASVSHELRAPVASIRLMADALEAEKVAPGTAKEFHRLIAREGARLSTLVGNVLDHARIEQGKRVWKMEPCDLESLVADTLRVMEPLAREKNITLRSALVPLEAAVDAGAIQQALVNLLDNAIKFSPAGSTIETSLSIYEERRTWRVAVRDEGPGIASAEQARIFERFYRPGDELRRETQGTGIGLSLVKAIAEAHGGSVSVESDPGHGSTFTLTAPHR